MIKDRAEQNALFSTLQNMIYLVTKLKQLGI